MSDASACAAWAMVREQFRLAERTAVMTAKALEAQKAVRKADGLTVGEFWQKKPPRRAAIETRADGLHSKRRTEL